MTRSPAEAGQDADPQDKEAGGTGRRLFRRGRRAATRPAGPPADDDGGGTGPADEEGATTAPPPSTAAPREGPQAAGSPGAVPTPGFASAPPTPEFDVASPPSPKQAPQPPAFQPPLVIFQPPDLSSAPPPSPSPPAAGSARRPAPDADAAPAEETRAPGASDQDDDGETGSPKRRRRGGRGHGKARGSGDDGAAPDADSAASDAEGPAKSGGRAPADAGEAADDRAAGAEENEAEAASPARRRRRRRRSGAAADADAPASDDPPNTVVHVRAPRTAADDAADVRGVKGSTRLEAKRQRRREGRESGRRRPPIITESEFLARREAVERVMVVRQNGDRTQIAVLEDGILVEHYVDKASHQSYVGNVYLGRVQNVLPSMEAAFVDIGKGRNAVLYAGEVNFDASGLEGESKRIESALKSGQSILVQVTKDPIGHKGARLTSQVSLPGRYLVYVPGANMTGISRKLPDTERTRLKQILKQVMPENAGVIVRTAAEGATEEELSHDVARLAAQWEAIERKAKSATAPELLYSEPDLTIRVVRDIFNEDFTRLVIASDGDWDMVDEYVRYVAPNLAERLERWTGDQEDVFEAYRIDEQIAKALERKVWLPSGGSLVIDTTEAMTVIDVNTGKFTGQGGNLEQTVTRNNLEAAEEIVRQLRVRDVGGIIVIDFIDMVLESNRDLVLRRLLECLARDRTKHQVAEVTSLGLVQMTRKRVGSGLLEAFSVPCECCSGRGVIVSLEPVDHVPAAEHHHGRDGSPRGGASRVGASRAGGRGSAGGGAGSSRDAAEAGPAVAKPGPPRSRAPVMADGEAMPAAAGPGPVEVGPAAGDPPNGSAADGGQGGRAQPGQGGEGGGGSAGGDAAGSSRRASGGRRRRRAAQTRDSAASGGEQPSEAPADEAGGGATLSSPAGPADGPPPAGGPPPADGPPEGPDATAEGAAQQAQAAAEQTQAAAG